MLAGELPAAVLAVDKRVVIGMRHSYEALDKRAGIAMRHQKNI